MNQPYENPFPLEFIEFDGGRPARGDWTVTIEDLALSDGQPTRIHEVCLQTFSRETIEAWKLDEPLSICQSIAHEDP